MSLSEKMEKMLEVIKRNDASLTNNNFYNRYFAPDIPEKIMKKLIKHFDNHLAVSGVVAFYDTTIFSSSKEGILFTNDGIYYKYLFSNCTYFQYKDIKCSYIVDGTLQLETRCNEFPIFSIVQPFEADIIKNILDGLVKIDETYGQSTLKSTGKVKKLDLPPDMTKKCNTIIHSASVACGAIGTGLAQLPLTDNAAIVPIQITMIVSLGAVFELNITESVAKSIIASAGATIVGRGVSQVLWGWIPVLGNAINTATAAGVTEAIGWIAVKNFYERWIEDKNKGRYEGMKDGYSEASGEYERKLRKQADEFLKQMKDVEKERNEYEKLLTEYETYIKELEIKSASADTINEIKDIYNNLRKLKTA